MSKEQNASLEAERESHFNDWFLSLPKGRQAVLIEDKWLLAAAAFKAGQARAQLAAPSPAPAYRSYTTTPGEAVAGIALRQLKDESRWVEIRDLNAHAFPDIGPHDYYPVGTVLRLPAPASDVVQVPRELPDGKCCEPTEQELELLKNGDYTPEELWGAREPSCPKCVKKTAPRGATEDIAAELERITHDERTPNEISQELASVLIVLRSLLNGGR